MSDKKIFFYTSVLPLVVSLLLATLIIVLSQTQNKLLINILQHIDYFTGSLRSSIPSQPQIATHLLQHELPLIPWTMIIGLALAFLLPFLKPIWQTLVCVLLLFGLIASNAPTALPVLLTLILAAFNICYGSIAGSWRRMQIKQMFKQYVSREHIGAMLKNPKNYSLNAATKEMTVLFADIRNFTQVSEGMAVNDLKAMLNIFFAELTRVILENSGTLDKYIGDMVMAFWGAPLDDKEHAKHALAAAFKMQQVIENLTPLLTQRNIPPIKIGVGVNTGSMMVGDMGSAFRQSYTVLGDAVNTASRVESLTKYYRVGIIVTEATAHGQDEIIFRRLDKITVKGKQQPVIIYEPVCYRNTLDTPTLQILVEEMAQLQQAIEYYEVQQWDKSIALFDILHAHHPQVHLYTLYLERLGFLRGKLIENWNGIYNFTEK